MRISGTRYRSGWLAALLVLLAVVALRSGMVGSVPPDDAAAAPEGAYDVVLEPELKTTPARDENTTADLSSPRRGGQSFMIVPATESSDGHTPVVEGIEEGTAAGPEALAEAYPSDSTNQTGRFASQPGLSPGAAAFMAGAYAGAPRVGAFGGSAGGGISSGGGFVGGSQPSSSLDETLPDWFGLPPTSSPLGSRAGSTSAGLTNGDAEEGGISDNPSTNGLHIEPVETLLPGPPLDLDDTVPTDAAVGLPDDPSASQPQLSSLPLPRVVNPEPATLLLLGTGLAVAARQLRKRQR